MKYIHLCLILSLFGAQTTFTANEQEIAGNKDQNSLISAGASVVNKGAKVSAGLWLLLITTAALTQRQHRNLPLGLSGAAATLTLINSDTFKNITPVDYIGEIPTAILSMLTSIGLSAYAIAMSNKNSTLAGNITIGVISTGLSIGATALLQCADAALTSQKVTPAAEILTTI